MNFDPKTSKVPNQENVNKYLVRYGVCLNPWIKVEYGPHSVDVSQTSPSGSVSMHPQLLALELRLLMMRFIRSVLTFYRVTPS